MMIIRKRFRQFLYKTNIPLTKNQDTATEKEMDLYYNSGKKYFTGDHAVALVKCFLLQDTKIKEEIP